MTGTNSILSGSFSTVTYEGARPGCCYGDMGLDISTGMFNVPMKGKYRFDFQGISSVSQYFPLCVYLMFLNLKSTYSMAKWFMERGFKPKNLSFVG